ncbi:MAG: MATE family efflux transporter [Muribaculaceae bacterium]|nr:MATE family efflux transporter [Muribaculaceae bacterium]
MNRDKEYSVLLKLGFPVLITQLGVIIVSFSDTLMIGRYGTPELAAAAFVNSLFLIPIVMQIGFSSGLTPLIGALFSRNDLPEAGRMMKSGLLVNILLSVIFTLIMGALYFFIEFFNPPSDIIPLIRPYYLIILGSLLPMAVFASCQQTANGSTDTAMPMWIMLGGNILNITGNFLLIYGIGVFPELGLKGAGISTLFARWCMSFAILAVIFRRKRYKEYVSGFMHPLTRAINRVVIKTSYPVMIQSGVECMLWTWGAVVCGEFGKFQLAAYQVVNTIGQLGFMIYMSFAAAVSIRVANFTGLDNIEGIRRTTRAGLNISLILGTLASVVFIVFSHQLIRLFTPDDKVLTSALGLIIPLILYQYGDAVQLNYGNALRGMSVVKPLLTVSVIGYVVMGIPWLYIFAHGFGLGNVGVYYSFSLALFTCSILYYRSYRKAIRNFRPVQ